MKKVIINENEKGLLFKNGRFTKVLSAGKHYIPRGRQVQTQLVTNPVMTDMTTLDRLLKNKELAEMVTVADVKYGQFALHYVDGNYCRFLKPGKQAFWTDGKDHRFEIIDTSVTEVSPDLPAYVFDTLSPLFYRKFVVPSYAKGRLYYDEKYMRLLEPGVYRFWKNGTKVAVELADTRLIQMDVNGQEMLTADKVTLRINFVVNYRITDFVKIGEIGDIEQQIRLVSQLALRRFAGKNKLDDILDKKESIAEYVFDILKSKEKDLFVEFCDAGVKDIILPGEIRDIMNTVLVAEKRAQANVITRREEVASTRSLLNTAKLMDENRTLYKLKELEYIEKICENVGNITLNSGGDILSALTGILNR